LPWKLVSPDFTEGNHAFNERGGDARSAELSIGGEALQALIAAARAERDAPVVERDQALSQIEAPSPLHPRHISYRATYFLAHWEFAILDLSSQAHPEF
jgi:hypothetical protein